MAARLPLPFLSGHLGASVSALVDGQLDQDSADRAWAHVETCAACRRLVGSEGWVKRQLSQIGGPQDGVPSERLMGSLLDLDEAAASWSVPEEHASGSRGRRRVGIALVGAGSVSAAVLGLATLGTPLGGGSGARPATSIGGATSTPTPTRTAAAPAGAVPVRGPLSGRVPEPLPGWAPVTPGAEVARARVIDVRR